MSAVLRYALTSLRGRPLTHLLLCAALSLVMALPLGVYRLVRWYDQVIQARAEGIPLVMGARGSRLDLTLAALYFTRDVPAPMRWEDAASLHQQGLGRVYPFQLGFEARRDHGPSVPVVGTDPAYLDEQGLGLAAGEPLRSYGDVLAGAAVARRWNLKPGDRVQTLPSTRFDFSRGLSYTLRVVGVLTASGTPDDEVLWVHTNTGWIFQGIGHGHEDVDLDHSVAPAEARRDLSETDPGLFHFHGSPDSFPLSAAAFFPTDARAAAIALGRYASHERLQLLRPADVVRDLMHLVFQVERLYRANGLLVLFSTGLLLLVIMSLSLRLREGELSTLHKLGVRRAVRRQLLGCEWALLLGISALTALGLVTLVLHWLPSVLGVPG